MNVNDVRARSRGFVLWKKLQAERGKVTLDMIAEETGVNITTVRRFCAEPDGDVRNATILYAGVFAQYFGVTLDELLVFDKITFNRPAAVSEEAGSE